MRGLEEAVEQIGHSGSVSTAGVLVTVSVKLAVRSLRLSESLPRGTVASHSHYKVGSL